MNIWKLGNLIKLNRCGFESDNILTYAYQESINQRPWHQVSKHLGYKDSCDICNRKEDFVLHWIKLHDIWTPSIGKEEGVYRVCQYCGFSLSASEDGKVWEMNTGELIAFPFPKSNYELKWLDFYHSLTLRAVIIVRFLLFFTEYFFYWVGQRFGVLGRKLERGE
jgi:hypothetical protein